jgi:hypothetical protein
LMTQALRAVMMMKMSLPLPPPLILNLLLCRKVIVNKNRDMNPILRILTLTGIPQGWLL